MRIARPFTLTRHHHHGPSWRYGIGWYLLDDHDATRHHVLHHTQEEVLARGESLIQHRLPAMPTNPSGSVFSHGLNVVSSILPQQVLIWRWPVHIGDPTVFPFNDGHITEAPNEVVQVMEVVVKDGKRTMQPALRVLERSHPPHRFPMPSTPVSVAHNPFGQFAAPALGDLLIFGQSTGAPLKLDTLLPSIPPETERDKVLRQMREAMVVRMQTGDGLRDAVKRDAARAARRPLPEAPAIMTALAARKPRAATATAVEGFELADVLIEERTQ